MKRIIAAFVLLRLAFPATAFAQDSYDPAANASTLIKGALGRAKKDHKRVLVIFGTNEETKCTTLHNDTLRATQRCREWNGKIPKRTQHDKKVPNANAHG